jgi:hypothetical protein
MKAMATSITELLGGEEVLGPDIRTALDLARATRKGLPRMAADWLSKVAGNVLSASDGGVRLSPIESDNIVRIARILAKAIDVLEDQAKAVHWLNTPNRALGGEIPINLLDTSSGEHEVEALLDRIEYGVYS